jgi:predicted RNA-binding Zn-ribbon protein involved in translation (DUF1610 family)
MVQFGIQLGASSHSASGPAAERQYVRCACVSELRDFRWRLYYRTPVLASAVLLPCLLFFALALELPLILSAILSVVALAFILIGFDRYSKIHCPSCESEIFTGRQGERRGDTVYECDSCNATYLNGRRQRT